VGLESNPEVLTKYAHQLGVHEDWCFSDVVGLDADSLKIVPQPCVGAIFLYPFSQCEARKRTLGTHRGTGLPNVWFMKQQVGNACGAVAIMHTVMNNMQRISSAKGFLESFNSDTASASGAERAKLFAPAVRELHSGLASQGQTDAPAANADLDFHFVRRWRMCSHNRRRLPACDVACTTACAQCLPADSRSVTSPRLQVSLVAVSGRLYELDGNNDGPIDCGVVIASQEDFLPAAVAHVQSAYIGPFPNSHFSMIALGPTP